jgi:hypothetical protein
MLRFNLTPAGRPLEEGERTESEPRPPEQEVRSGGERSGREGSKEE